MNPARFEIVTSADAWSQFGSLPTPQFVAVEAALEQLAQSLARSVLPSNELNSMKELKVGSIVAICDVDAHRRRITVLGVQRSSDDHAEGA